MKTALMDIITAGWKTPRKAAENEIVLGQSAPLTGGFGALGREYRDGARLYFEMTNEQGGVNGHRVNLVTLDDGYEPSRAIENTRILIDKHKAVAMFGHMLTSTVHASFAITNPSGIPYVAPYTGHSELFEKHHETLFLTRTSFSSELDALLNYVKNTGRTRAALVRYDSVPGAVLQKEFEDKMRALEMSPSGSATMKLNSYDPSSAVAALSKLRPSCIVLGVSGADASEFIRQFNRERSAEPVQYVARSVVGAHQLACDLKNEAHGMVVSQLAPSPFDGKTRVARDYLKDVYLAQSTGKDFEPSHVGFEGYVAASVMVEGLRRAGPDLSSRNLIQAMETMDEWDVGDFPVSFGPENHKGSNFVTITVIGQTGHFVKQGIKQ